MENKVIQIEEGTLAVINVAESSVVVVPEKPLMGRPLTYDDNVTPTSAQEYLDGCVDTPYVLTKSEGNNSLTYENRLRVKLPTLEGLALHLGVRRSTVHEWMNRFPNFSDVVDKILARQAELLLNNGLAGTYNASISKVILTKHGYREGIEQTGKDGEPIKSEVRTVVGMKIIKEDGTNIQDKK